MYRPTYDVRLLEAVVIVGDVDRGSRVKLTAGHAVHILGVAVHLVEAQRSAQFTPR